MTYQPYIIINIEKLELLMQGLFCRLKQMCIYCILFINVYNVLHAHLFSLQHKFYNDIII